MTDPFDFDHFLAIPRLSALRLSPDGGRLVVTVATPAPDGKRMASAIWEVDPSGERQPRRLTRSAKGESVGAFLPDGSLLFTSARPDPDAKEPDAEPPAALWLLPKGGGEARLLLSPKAGVDAILVARDAGTVVVAAEVFKGAADLDADAAREKARTDAGVKALLFESYPIRFWDHWLGPREQHLLTADGPADEEAPLGEVTDLTPDAGVGLVDVVAEVSPDGTFVVTPWKSARRGIQWETADLVRIDRATKQRRRLTHADDDWYETPRISPDSRWVVAVHSPLPRPDDAPHVHLQLIELATGAARDLTPDLDRWPHDPVWSHDGTAVFFLADDDGATVPWRVDVSSGAITRLASDASYHELNPSPDGSTLYALRATLDRPPHVVRLDARAADQHPTELRSPTLPADRLPRRGRVERLTATADDGATIRSWLVLPAGASPEQPAPLVVFVHGGPVGSWVGWHWRWNAHLLAERGYAVVMPDPAISTGYGRDFIQRGWGTWGHRPYTDIVAAVDNALERPDVDRERTALMGGSFGGYMANWVAGSTDRYRAIVTHASLWDLRGFHGTTDHGPSWEQEMGDPYTDPARYVEHSPSRLLANIRTPMLVIHGEQDHRVPISEALILWTDLQRHGVPAKFLYFPDENHWILKPQNARIWYATVLNFLDEHVLGMPWQRPDLL
jgi:dipeptidyl aminopeptidase/acylaminoacyl peptidase